GAVAGSHVYADNGTYTVTVTVSDDEGGRASDMVAGMVLSGVLFGSAGADQTVNEGTVVSLPPATFNDLGTLDTHTATIDWGDGKIGRASCRERAPYAPPGPTADAAAARAASHVQPATGPTPVTATAR